VDQHVAGDDVTLLDGAGAALLDVAVAVARLDRQVTLGDVQVENGVDRGDGHPQVLRDLRARRERPGPAGCLVELHDERQQLGSLPRRPAHLLVDGEEEIDELVDHRRVGGGQIAESWWGCGCGLRPRSNHV